MIKFKVKAELLDDQTEIILNESEMEGLTDSEIDALANEKANDWIRDQISYSISKAE